MRLITDNFEQAQPDNHGVIIRISGDIDMYTSPDLRTELMSHIGKKITPILVDFGEVSYVDSSGIATLVEALKLIKEYNGALKLIAIPKGVIEIFNFLKLEKVFEIYSGVDAFGTYTKLQSEV